MKGRLLAIDASTKTGWALFVDGIYVESGALKPIPVEGFNVNDDPNKSPLYPWNIIDAAEKMAQAIMNLATEKQADDLVIENTVKGRNRHTQRYLEYLHSAMFRKFRNVISASYRDPSEWRKACEMRLSNDQKKNNREVSAGKKRGRIGKKHLSVNMANEKFGLKLKLKDNDQADACLLGLGHILLIDNMEKLV
jgi:hypothetical protein